MYALYQLISLFSRHVVIALDIHGRIRLINYIRKNVIPCTRYGSLATYLIYQNLSSEDARNLTGKGPSFLSDEYLIPVIENDALLRQ